MASNSVFRVNRRACRFFLPASAVFLLGPAAVIFLLLPAGFFPGRLLLASDPFLLRPLAILFLAPLSLFFQTPAKLFVAAPAAILSGGSRSGFRVLFLFRLFPKCNLRRFRIIAAGQTDALPIRDICAASGISSLGM